jgi:L-threonylcarbamoyladenylate synthase
MSTSPLVLSLTEDSDPLEIIQRSAEILRAGGLAVCPTETTYGLLVRADDPACLQRLIEVKGRPPNMATSIFIRDRKHLNSLAILNKYGQILVDKYLPGPLTLVLRDQSNLPGPVVVNSKIGIRWSSHPLIAGLVAELTFPLTATSANVSGKGGENDPGEIRQAFGNRIDLIIDAGPGGTAVSTVIDCSEPLPRILREGGVSRDEIETAIGIRVS